MVRTKISYIVLGLDEETFDSSLHAIRADPAHRHQFHRQHAFPVYASIDDELAIAKTCLAGNFPWCEIEREETLALLLDANGSEIIHTNTFVACRQL